MCFFYSSNAFFCFSMLLAHHLIIPFPLIPLFCISRRKKNLLYSQQLSLHITQVHNYNCTKAGREALRAKEDKEELRVKCAPLSAVWCAESSRPTRSFVQERKRHKRGSCRCQLVMTHTRGRAEGQSGGTRRSLSRADCCTWGGDEWRGLFSTCQPSLPFTFKRSSANHGIKYTWKTHFHHFSSLTNTS